MTIDPRSNPPLQLLPFRIEPQFVPRIWGTRDLRPWFQHVASSGEPIGEVWLTGDQCLAATGPFAGQSLAALFRQFPALLLGPDHNAPDSPLLIKILFAQQKLSVQVHPDDQLAQKYGQPRGKTECWYALAADPGAQVACGLVPGTTLDQIRAEIADGTLEQSLLALPVAPQDMIFVDAGTVHAIWPGSVILETQQNCDITYRIFDYGRPRELHIEKSLEATRLTTRAGKRTPVELPDRTLLLDEDYFRIERLHPALNWSSHALSAGSPPSMAYLFVSRGSGRLLCSGFEPIDLPPCGILAIPASAPPFTVEDLGNLQLIRITPHWPSRT
jgi:mannose-6-phosphate isomerase